MSVLPQAGVLCHSVRLCLKSLMSKGQDISKTAHPAVGGVMREISLVCAVGPVSCTQIALCQLSEAYPQIMA